MGQVDAFEHLLGHAHVHREPRLLDAVAGEVLGAGHGVLLQAASEGRAHLTGMTRVLAIALLRPAPTGMAEQVEAGSSDQVGALRPGFAADGLAHPLFEPVVEGGRPRDGDGEAGGHAHRHTSGAVGESDAVKPQPRDPRSSVDASLTVLAGGAQHPPPEVRLAGEQP